MGIGEKPRKIYKNMKAKTKEKIPRPLYEAAVFVTRPTECESVAQGLFFGGSRRRAVDHTRPGFPKNAYGPVGIPLIRGASGAGRLTQPSSKGGKSLGKGPLRPKENFQSPSHTRPDPCRRQHGRSKCDPATECHFSMWRSALHLLVCPAIYGRCTSSLCGERWVIPNIISLKGNMMAQLEIELAYFNAAVQNLRHCTMETQYLFVLFMEQIDTSEVMFENDFNNLNTFVLKT